MSLKERIDLQSSVCGTIGVCIQRLHDEDVRPLVDRTMQLVLQVFATKGATAHEDAFMTLGFIADKIGKITYIGIYVGYIFVLLIYYFFIIHVTRAVRKFSAWAYECRRFH
jgi:hypothetical protein